MESILTVRDLLDGLFLKALSDEEHVSAVVPKGASVVAGVDHLRLAVVGAAREFVDLFQRRVGLVTEVLGPVLGSDALLLEVLLLTIPLRLGVASLVVASDRLINQFVLVVRGELANVGRLDTELRLSTLLFQSDSYLVVVPIVKSLVFHLPPDR